MRHFLLILAVVFFLAVLGFFAYFQNGGKDFIPTASKNYLVFKDVSVSQLSENQKLWELKVKEAEFSGDKSQILLNENSGFIFDQDKKPVFELTAPQAQIEPGKNQIIFFNPRGRELDLKDSLIETMSLDRLTVFSDVKKIEGEGNIVFTGKKMKIFSEHLLGDEQLRKVILTGSPVFQYLALSLKKEVVLKSPRVEADQKHQVVTAAGPVNLFWSEVKMTAHRAQYLASQNIFTLSGGVKIVYNDATITGDNLSFNPEKDEITLTGRPVIARKGEEILKGNEMILFLKDRRLKIKEIGQLKINLEGK